MPRKSNTPSEARNEFVQLALVPNANIQSLFRRGSPFNENTRSGR